MVLRSKFAVIVVAVVMAALPLGNVAQAATNDEVIAQQKAAMQAAEILANSLNDLARCRLAAAGQPVPGTVAFSQPEPANVVASCTPAMGTSGGATPTNTVNAGMPGCVTSLTTFQQNEINEWAISVAKAHSNNMPEPAMSADVAALIGAC